VTAPSLAYRKFVDEISRVRAPSAIRLGAEGQVYKCWAFQWQRGRWNAQKSKKPTPRKIVLR
jgi:hypothetical protein